MLGRETKLGARLECLAGFSGRAGASSEIDSGRDSKGSFYPLNYGNSDIWDFGFSIADYKQRTSAVCAEIASVLSDTGNYTAIQRLVLRQDAIGREAFERAIATTFTQFAHKIRRFDQRI
jgi:hypothetical protein